MSRTLRLTLLAALAILAGGCGYHLVGTTSTLPPELEVLYVRPFENGTDWADMDQRLTEAVVQEWVRRRRFQVAAEEESAQIVLRGRISSLNLAPVTLDEQGRATEYQMTLTAGVELLDMRGEDPVTLWQDKGFSRRTSYQVDVSAVDYFDRQIEAMDEVSAEFARALVSAVLEGF